MKLTWHDIARIAIRKINQVETVTMDEINDSILEYLEAKHCYQCPAARSCHKNCSKCDEMSELLEEVGFEI